MTAHLPAKKVDLRPDFTRCDEILTAWMFLAVVIAVRQALDYESMERTMGVCLVGGFLHVLIGSMLR